MAKYFFSTDKESRLIHLYVRDNDKETEKIQEFENSNLNKRLKKKIPRSVKIQYKDFIYHPTKFETLNQKSIQKYRKNFSKRYLLWSLKNKNLLAQKSKMDALTTFGCLKDVFYGFLITSTSCFFLNNFMKKMDPPIFDFFLFTSKKFQPRHLRITFLALSFLGFNYQILNGNLKKDDLFDTGLKYKEYFAEGELQSPNCEEMFQELAGSKIE